MKSAVNIFLLMMVFGSTTANPTTSNPRSERISLIITCLEKVPIVEVRLNGSTAYFVLDSGSDISILNSTDVDQYDFEVRNTSSRDLKGFSGGRQGIFGVSNTELMVQNQLLNAKFYATDLSHLVKTLENQTSIKINGIIGLDVLKAYDFEIDYGKGLLTFSH